MCGLFIEHHRPWWELSWWYYAKETRCTLFFANGIPRSPLRGQWCEVLMFMLLATSWTNKHLSWFQMTSMWYQCIKMSHKVQRDVQINIVMCDFCLNPLKKGHLSFSIPQRNKLFVFIIFVHSHMDGKVSCRLKTSTISAWKASNCFNTRHKTYHQFQNKYKVMYP